MVEVGLDTRLAIGVGMVLVVPIIYLNVNVIKNITELLNVDIKLGVSLYENSEGHLNPNSQNSNIITGISSL